MWDMSVSPVHPRARGEHQCLDDFFVYRVGSSPRTRGTLGDILGDPNECRFIPAHAGNMDPTGKTSGYLPGSSPRTRGTYGRRSHCRHVYRFIPAHAGNIAATVFAPIIGDGSSPRTRGTCHGRQRVGREGRFIPAHAGNIRPIVATFHRTAVHPRARGEHRVHHHLDLRRVGSSPRTRGTCQETLAGPPLPPVHPRARGEHPRTARPISRYRRFIPAHAGNIVPWTTRSSRPCGSSPRTRGTLNEILD